MLLENFSENSLLLVCCLFTSLLLVRRCSPVPLTHTTCKHVVGLCCEEWERVYDEFYVSDREIAFLLESLLPLKSVHKILNV